MQQGYSGSTVQLKGGLVEKVSSDQTFMQSPARQNDLISMSRKLSLLPRIDHIDRQAIYMEYIDGQEGLTEHNAREAGKALRQLHAQREYRHACETDVNWLIQLANESLAQMDDSQRISADIAGEYPPDALIHSEPVQFIEKPDGSIVFIDIEGIGW